MSAADVENFSNQGCCVHGSFAVGERFSIRLPRYGIFTAQVCWAAGGKAGLRLSGGTMAAYR